MILGTYDPTYGDLLEDQWLLKIREDVQYGWKDGRHFVEKIYKTGFFTKLTKKENYQNLFMSGVVLNMESMVMICRYMFFKKIIEEAGVLFLGDTENHRIGQE